MGNCNQQPDFPLVVQQIVLFATLALFGLGGFAAPDAEPSSVRLLLGKVFGALPLAAILHAFLAFVSLAVRRLHDLGLPGWYLLVMLAVTLLVGLAIQVIFGSSMHPLHWLPVGLVLSLVLYVVPGIPKGSPKPNRWGERPATWPPEERSQSVTIQDNGPSAGDSD